MLDCHITIATVLHAGDNIKNTKFISTFKTTHKPAGLKLPQIHHFLYRLVVIGSLLVCFFLLTKHIFSLYQSNCLGKKLKYLKSILFFSLISSVRASDCRNSVFILGPQNLSIYIGLGTCIGVLALLTIIIMATMFIKRTER